MTKPHMDESETEVKYNLDRFKNGTCVTIEDFHNTDDCISINSYENDLSCLLVNKHANTVPLTDFDGSYNKEDTLERNDSRMLGDSDEHKEKEELTLDYDKHDKGKPVVCSNETTSSKRNEVQNIKVKGQVTSVSTPLPKKNSKSICTEGMRNKEPEKPEPRENPKGLHKEQKQGWQTLYFLLLLLPALTTCLHAKTPEHRKCDLNFICELRKEEILLKCHYSMLCYGTKKWTGGVDGLLIFTGGVKETLSGKIFEYVESNSGDWFGLAIKNWTNADVFTRYMCWMMFDKNNLDLFEQPIIDKTNDDDPVTCNEELGMVIMNITVLHITQNPSFTYFIEKENFTQNLKVSQRSEKKGPWFITDIYAKIIRENNVNKTFYLVYKGNKTVTLIEKFVLCNGRKATLRSKDNSMIVEVAVSLSVLVIIALSVLLGCCKKKISKFCRRHGRGTSSAATSTSNSKTSGPMKPLMSYL